jgi:hypothetical protein
MRPMVRNLQNNDIYEYLGENKFRNVRTGKEGIIDETKAKDVFKFNIEVTEMINEFPIIETMIQKLNLKSDGISCL